MSRMKNWSRVWDRLAVRERRMLAVAVVVLLVAGLWGFAIAPALKTLQAAPAQLEQLDAQLQSMEKLALQARTMQNRTAVNHDDAVRFLGTSLQQGLGASAQLSLVGDRATVTLKAAAPDLLALWLGQARTGARAVVRQASLSRGAGGWDGTLVLEMPPL